MKDIDFGEMPAFKGHTNGIVSIDFSPDGKRIISGSWDCTIRIWNSFTGEQIGPPLKGHRESVLDAKFFPDGSKIASAS